MEEDEDQFLLSSLGVISANPADLEQTILDEATKKLDNNEGETVEEQSIQHKGSNLLASSQNELLNKLRAVKFEIDAVASTVEPVDEFAAENSGQKDDESDVHGLHSGSVFQQALATDRLRTLKKRKIQIEKELTGLHGASGSADHDNLLRDLVKDEPSLKRRMKEIRKPSKREGKKVKVVSFHEDTDFDAVFDAASAGFVETERDELVRKGNLTPFHKLEGFESRLPQPGSSNSRNLPEAEDENDKNEDSSAIDRAVQSMVQAAKARPTAKLLDAEDLPKLEPPTAPFRRLRKLYKTQDSSDNEAKKSKGRKKSKKTRPLPWKEMDKANRL